MRFLERRKAANLRLEEESMKPLFVAFSRYNRKANALLFAALGGLEASRLGLAIKAYYPTIVDTLFHVMRSDLKWLGRLGSFRASVLGPEALSPYSREDKPALDLVAKDLPGFVELRAKIDAEIELAVASIPEEAFARGFEIAWGSGRLERPLWQILMQWFNHQTHHRGQASVQLDALGIDNDYSGLLDKIE